MNNIYIYIKKPKIIIILNFFKYKYFKNWFVKSIKISENRFSFIVDLLISRLFFGETYW